MGRKMPRGWAKTRLRILARDGYICHLCWKYPPPANSVDHIVPEARGGTHEDSNLQAAHLSCNQAKNLRRRRFKNPPPRPSRWD